MIQILIVILFLCILAVLYLSKPKWLEKKNAVDMGTYRGAYFPILFYNNC